MENINMLEYEKKYLLETTNIAGCDEAGRGPLAGPVCVACCIMPLNEEDIIKGVNDSKKLSEKKRLQLFEIIKQKAIKYSIVFIDEKTIDSINILNATKLGMKKAIEEVMPSICLVDAISKLDTDVKLEGIIKGDAKSYSIACASILAKVSRDKLMLELDEKYPQYNLKKHKGYGTKEHIENLKKFGPSPIHRKSFIGNFVDIEKDYE